MGPFVSPDVAAWSAESTRRLLLSPTPAWSVPQGVSVRLHRCVSPHLPDASVPIVPMTRSRTPSPLRALPACHPVEDFPLLLPHQLAERFPTCQRWTTDGSVQDVLCGAAFVQLTDAGDWQPFELHLPDGLTIDVCEVYALQEAVLSVPLDEPRAVIFSDSSAALAGLLKFSRLPYAYRFKEQGPLFARII